MRAQGAGVEGGITVASLHVKAAKVVVLAQILQIVQIGNQQVTWNQWVEDERIPLPPPAHQKHPRWSTACALRPIPAVSLALEPANITAVANDVGTEVIFLRQLIAQGTPVTWLWEFQRAVVRATS